MIYQNQFSDNLKRESIRLSRCMLCVPSLASSFILELFPKRCGLCRDIPTEAVGIALVLYSVPSYSR